MYFLQQQWQKKLLRGVDVTMFQKIHKIINVIKICHFMRCDLMDFIFICLSLSISFVVIIKNMSRLKSLLPVSIERQTGVIVLQSRLFTWLGQHCTREKKRGNMPECLRCFSVPCPTILLKSWHHCGTCICSLPVCNDTLFRRESTFIALALHVLESRDAEIFYLPHLIDGFGKHALIPQGKVFNCHCKDYFCVSEAG